MRDNLNLDDIEGDGERSVPEGLFGEILFDTSDDIKADRRNRYLTGDSGTSTSSMSIKERFSKQARQEGEAKVKHKPLVIAPEVVSLREGFEALYCIVSEMGMNEESHNFFKQRFLLQTKITERLARKFNIDTANTSSKNDVSKLSLVVAKLLSASKDLVSEKEREVVTYFEDVADEILDARKWWTIEWSEKQADLSAVVTLKVAALQALIKINDLIQKYPLYARNVDMAQKMLDFIILKSKDVARSWNCDELGADSRTSLYVAIVPLVTQILCDAWETAAKNKLESVRSLESQKIELKTFISDFLKNKGFDSDDILHTTEGITSYINKKTVEFQNSYRTVEHTIYARLKQTVLKNLINMSTNSLIESGSTYDNELALNKDLDKGVAMYEIWLDVIDGKIRVGGVLPIIEWGGFENLFDYNLFNMLGAAKAILGVKK